MSEKCDCFLCNLTQIPESWIKESEEVHENVTNHENALFLRFTHDGWETVEKEGDL